MAAIRKTKSAGKTNSKPSAKSRKKKAKKPKVVLSTKKVAVFSACVCCFCAVFLGLSVVLNENHKKLSPEKNEKVAEVSDKKTEKFFEKTAEKPKNQKRMESQATKIVEPNGKFSERNENFAYDSKLSGNSKSSGKNDSKTVSSSKSLVDLKPDVSKNAAQSQNAKNNSALKTAENVKLSSNSKSFDNSKSSDNLKPAESLKTQNSIPSSQNIQKNLDSKKLSESSPAKNSSVKNSSALKTEKKSEKPSSRKLSSGNFVSESPVSTNSSSKSVKIEKYPQKIAAVSNLNQNENAQNQALKNSRFDIPKAVNGATVVIVIDDAGRSVENVKRYAALPFPLTIAVLPRLANSRECAQISRNLGKEVILHQPMQSVNHNLDPGPGKISVDMSFSEISSIIKENLASLGPGVKGMNNHEGSEVTGDVLRIGAVLDACLENRIYFLDSRTTAQTKAPQAALERDMTIFEKAGPYIDNELSREKMLERLYETLRYANNHGHAIVIGHVDKSVNILPDLLSEMYPYMRAAGYRFATPSTLR